MESQPHEPTPVHAPPPPSLGEGEQPPIDAIFDAGDAGAGDQSLVTHVTCTHCGTKASWRGDVTADMLERTFTRGVNEQSGLPNCPRCGHELALDHVEPVESAVETAARALPDRTEGRSGQLTIPGIHPPFDYASAMHSILEQRAVVRRAEAIAESKHRDATKARKDAEAEQSTLSELEDKFAERVEELEVEAALTPEQRAERQAAGCSWEALTGTPCAVCRTPNPGQAPVFNGNPAHIAYATVIQSLSDDGISADELSAALKAVANLAVDVETVDAWSREARIAVAGWLEMPAMKPRPDVLGRAHIVSALAGTCEACDALLTPLAGAFGLEAWPVGQLVGTDCPGEPERAVRRPTRRHATKEARQKAVQAARTSERQATKRTPARAHKAGRRQPAARKGGKR
jgi:hypothetical protein